MPVIGMKCLKAEAHPKADRLRVYQFENPLTGVTHQVVANLTNVYEVDNVVGVVLPGSLLQTPGEESTFVIQPTTLRGVPSEGMALGLIEPDDLGKDVTHKFPEVLE